MLEVSKGFEEARNQRFAEKEKDYGGRNNPKNHINLSLNYLLMRILDQCHLIADPKINSDKSKLKKELIDTANLCELAWRKLR